MVGGGPAGLTVANRLSEDPSVNVLLLEAGPADTREPDVEIPGFIGDDIGSVYDWNLSTVAQTYLDGAPRSIPQGHALGGGTIINGMLWNRGGQGDYQDWVDLGNPGWSWDDLLPYFIKSETYTPVDSEEIAEQFSIEEWPDAHGFSGPVNVSFPKYFWNSSAVLYSALNEIGVPTAFDPNTGLIAGASFLPLDVDPVTEERSDARKAYYDPYASRPNFWVSTGQMVTQVLFEDRPPNSNASAPTPNDSSNGQGGAPGVPAGIFGVTTTLNLSNAVDSDAVPVKRNLLRWLRNTFGAKLRREQIPRTSPISMSNLNAIGVEYASNAQAPRQTVYAIREVVVAAGALHSPQLLMISGIGQPSALRALDIPVNVDLPGVGSNLQDHGQVWCWYPYYNASYPNPTELVNNQTFASDAWT